MNKLQPNLSANKKLFPAEEALDFKMKKVMKPLLVLLKNKIRLLLETDKPTKIMKRKRTYRIYKTYHTY